MTREDRNKMYMDYFTEKYVVNEKDITYNKEKFDSGEINLCFILGLSGSGKTTMANNITKECIQLDDILFNYKFSDDELKKYGNIIDTFFRQNKNYRFHNPEDGGKLGESRINKMFSDFIKFAIQYSKSHKQEKIVIEGVEIFWSVKPKDLEDYAVYIKGTSTLISLIRAAKRNSKNEKTGVKGFLRILTDKEFLHIYKTDETSIRKWREFFKSKISKEKR